MRSATERVKLLAESSVTVMFKVAPLSAVTLTLTGPEGSGSLGEVRMVISVVSPMAICGGGGDTTISGVTTSIAGGVPLTDTKLVRVPVAVRVAIAVKVYAPAGRFMKVAVGVRPAPLLVSSKVTDCISTTAPPVFALTVIVTASDGARLALTVMTASVPTLIIGSLALDKVTIGVATMTVGVPPIDTRLVGLPVAVRVAIAVKVYAPADRFMKVTVGVRPVPLLDALKLTDCVLTTVPPAPPVRALTVIVTASDGARLALTVMTASVPTLIIGSLALDKVTIGVATMTVGVPPIDTRLVGLPVAVRVAIAVKVYAPADRFMKVTVGVRPVPLLDALKLTDCVLTTVPPAPPVLALTVIVTALDGARLALTVMTASVPTLIIGLLALDKVTIGVATMTVGVPLIATTLFGLAVAVKV